MKAHFRMFRMKKSLNLLQHIVTEAEGDSVSSKEDTENERDLGEQQGEKTDDREKAVDENKMDRINSEEAADHLNLCEQLELEKACVELNGDLEQVKTEPNQDQTEEHLQKIVEESDDESCVVTETSIQTAESGECANRKKKIKQRKKKRKLKEVINKDRPRTAVFECKHSSTREESSDKDSLSDQCEVMSDQGPSTGASRRRKLAKRGQIRKFRSLEITPSVFVSEKLEQKYYELAELLSGQFVEQKSALSKQHLHQMELLRQQYASASHGLPPSGVLVPKSMPSHIRQRENNNHGARESNGNLPEGDEAYSTIRSLQTTKSVRGRSRVTSPPRQRSGNHAHYSRPQANNRNREQKRNADNMGTGSAGSLRQRRERSLSGSPRNRSADDHSNSSKPDKKQPVHEDHHLKNTDDPLMKQWLHKKNIEYRKQKARERAKKREERKKAVQLATEKVEKHLESKIAVKVWMAQKKKEAVKHAKAERKEKKVEETKIALQNAQKVSMVTGQSINRPLSAPAASVKTKLRVSRPGTTMADVKTLQDLPVAGEETTENVRNELLNRRLVEEEKKQASVAQKILEGGPQPPTSRFIYRRPVLGKVRLRMRQKMGQRNAQEEKKKVPVNCQTKEECEKKLRMSYDDWLAKKQREDNRRKEEMAKQKELAKSDTELDRKVPQLTQHGVHSVLRGKKYVQSIEQPNNESIASFHQESDVSGPELEQVTRQMVDLVLRSVSDERIGEKNKTENYPFQDKNKNGQDLKVDGAKASMSDRQPGNARPRSASGGRVPTPKHSKSPRRPVSAHPTVKSVTNTSNSETGTNGTFSVPFPPGMGIPPHVASVQNKLFSPKIWVKPEEEERPEPQGCDATDQLLGTDTDGVKEEMLRQEETEEISANMLFLDLASDMGDSNLNTSKNSSKKVSFCEETVVIDENEVGSSSFVEEHLEDGEAEDDKTAAADFMDLNDAVPLEGIFLTKSE